MSAEDAWEETECPECDEPVGFFGTFDGAPVNVVRCEKCGAIFNRATGVTLSKPGLPCGDS